jgi:hypothetical protein
VARRWDRADPLGGRLALVVIATFVIELIRYQLFHELYARPLAWAVVVASVALNVTYHSWSMPQTYVKVAVSALYTQLTLPPVVVWVWSFIKTTMSPPLQ